MRLRLSVKTGSASIALAMTAIGLPALAQESPVTASPAPAAEAVHPVAPEATQPPIFGLSPQARAEWLTECRHRIAWRTPYKPWYDHHDSWRSHHVAEAAPAGDLCESYLNDYYAYYANAYASYVQYIQANYSYARAAHGTACCHEQPTCTETVEYEDAPLRPAVRRIPRRAAPEKRVNADPVN